MATYVPHASYRLYDFAGRLFAAEEVEITQTSNGVDIQFLGFDRRTGEVKVKGGMRLSGDNLVVDNGEIVSGSIGTVQFFAFEFEYYAGRLESLNWDGTYLQNFLSETTDGNFSPFYDALTGAVDLVRGISSDDNYDHSEYYDATDIHLGAGNDSYTHPRLTEMSPLIIDGGEGHDNFQAGIFGSYEPLLIDVAKNLFVDEYGVEHVVRNFEFFQGGRGNDTLIGAMDRPNQFYGYQGSDHISGGNHDDYLAGGSGLDTILAYGGDDYILGSSHDYVDGGDGIDTFGYRLIAGYVYIDLENQEDNRGDAIYTVLVNIENLNGSNYYDVMLGDANDNVIETFGYRDILHGRDGNDTLDAGEGNDDLSGGTGANLLIGGAGADNFIFETQNATDTIADFEVGIDSLDFSALTSQADFINFELNGMSYSRISCFGDFKLGNVSLRFVQSQEDVEIYLDPSLGGESASPLITLIDIGIHDLIVDDFIF
ncbi:hypothetical protein EBB79_12780 [Parasedimentitalea marina]|uniref:Calcium-binding protein n=1 Tax=Parasedimentitalea marina TaxID=2483033 RepID=A0A3T0N3Q1_9RHOB|nr:calcium-binding protein [Parasedimentitalea marina]AZV78663.1 hypothetical protein EBB79_12780 [Parasedimentitalea marina]